MSPTAAPARPVPGTIAWLDLNAPDVEAAARFYGALMGWTFHLIETPIGTYHVAQVRGRDVAGLMGTHPAGPTPVGAAWTVFVEVTSVEEAAAAASAAGGAVLQPPAEVPGSAQVAVLADPAGAMLAVIESPPGSGTLLRGEPGGLFWAEVLSRDVEAVRPFYSAVFGWEAMTGPTGYTAFLLDGLPVAGLMAAPPQLPGDAPSHWLVSFTVADLDRTVVTAVGLGAVVVAPPTPVDGGRFAVLDDPGGATFAVFAPGQGARGPEGPGR